VICRAGRRSGDWTALGYQIGNGALRKRGGRLQREYEHGGSAGEIDGPPLCLIGWPADHAHGPAEPVIAAVERVYDPTAADDQAHGQPGRMDGAGVALAPVGRFC
jgi:hypothetical protein